MDSFHPTSEKISVGLYHNLDCRGHSSKSSPPFTADLFCPAAANYLHDNI